MKAIRALLAVGLLAAILAGCASGPKHDALDVAMPALKPGYGRIYFLRSSAFIGSPVQPEIKLNNQVVGRSRPRGFFFVDRPAGAFRASSATSVTSGLNFDLYPGEVKYVRTEVSIAVFGVMPGSVSFTLMDESIGEPELRKLSYTGRTVAVPKQAKATSAQTAGAQPASATPVAAAATPQSVESPRAPAAAEMVAVEGQE